MAIAKFVCPTCGRVSYNKNDVRERYCGFCHTFADRNVVSFIPQVTYGPDRFICGICQHEVFRSVALDHWPTCAMCRWFCNVEGNWGRRHDGIGT